MSSSDWLISTRQPDKLTYFHLNYRLLKDLLTFRYTSSFKRAIYYMMISFHRIMGFFSFVFEALKVSLVDCVERCLEEPLVADNQTSTLRTKAVSSKCNQYQYMFKPQHLKVIVHQIYDKLRH